MSARVAFLSRPVGPKDEKARTLISNKTLIKRNGKSAVFSVKGDHAVETPVTTGEVMGAMTEVLSGLKVGDKVVTNPPDKLKNGSRIKVAE